MKLITNCLGKIKNPNKYFSRSFESFFPRVLTSQSTIEAKYYKTKSMDPFEASTKQFISFTVQRYYVYLQCTTENVCCNIGLWAINLKSTVRKSRFNIFIEYLVRDFSNKIRFPTKSIKLEMCNKPAVGTNQFNITLTILLYYMVPHATRVER